MRVFFSIIILCAAVAVSGKANKNKHAPKSGYASLIDCSHRRVLPGRQGSPIMDEYRFTIKWLNAEPPTLFYSYINNEWKKCGVQSSKDIPVRNLKNIKKGDVITLMPLDTVHDPVGNCIKPSNNSIYFKTNKSGWAGITAKVVKESPVLALP
ncbi:MAG: hypothetical protein H0X33_12545 [Taibaiella sp.]|nr:hypothetical protein [Taibaiella sp.]